MSKTVALEKHKEWMMAIGSGKVEQVDQLIRAGILRKVEIQGMLDMYDHAAQRVYRTHSKLYRRRYFVDYCFGT